MDRVTLQTVIIARDIQTFNNKLDDFSRDCGFLSDAFTDLVNTEPHKPDSTMAGLTIFSHWVKSKTNELNQDMREIKAKSNTVLRQCTGPSEN